MHTRKIYDLEIDKVKRAHSVSFFQGTLISVLKQSILFILLWLIFGNNSHPGELISTQFILNTIFGPLQDLGNIILHYREAEASLQLLRRTDAAAGRAAAARTRSTSARLEELRFDDVVFSIAPRRRTRSITCPSTFGLATRSRSSARPARESPRWSNCWSGCTRRTAARSLSTAFRSTSFATTPSAGRSDS